MSLEVTAGHGRSCESSSDSDNLASSTTSEEDDTSDSDSDNDIDRENHLDKPGAPASPRVDEWPSRPVTLRDLVTGVLLVVVLLTGCSHTFARIRNHRLSNELEGMRTEYQQRFAALDLSIQELERVFPSRSSVGDHNVGAHPARMAPAPPTADTMMPVEQDYLLLYFTEDGRLAEKPLATLHLAEEQAGASVAAEKSVSAMLEELLHCYEDAMPEYLARISQLQRTGWRLTSVKRSPHSKVLLRKERRPVPPAIASVSSSKIPAKVTTCNEYMLVQPGKIGTLPADVGDRVVPNVHPEQRHILNRHLVKPLSKMARDGWRVWSTSDGQPPYAVVRRACRS